MRLDVLLLIGAAWMLPGAALAQDLMGEPTRSPFEFVQKKHGYKAVDADTQKASGGRVIGGQVAAQGAWPWQVGLVVAGNDEIHTGHFCGGSLVLDQWVLTAAHCVIFPRDDGTTMTLQPGQFEVFLGSNIMRRGEGDLIPVLSVHPHEAYTPAEFDNDIALIKLARPPQSGVFRTITVPTPDFDLVLGQEGITTFVTGWGRLNDGSSPLDLREVQIQVFDRQSCNDFMAEIKATAAQTPFVTAARTLGTSEAAANAAWSELVSGMKPALSNNMVCSGSFEGGKTSCNGDSGGPLVVPLQDGSFIQLGIVSWGLSSAEDPQMCNVNAPFSAYTRIANFIDWLNTTIAAN